MSFVLAMATCTISRNCWAEPARHVLLHWHAEPGCIDKKALATMVEETLGRTVFHGDTPAAATVDGNVTRTASGFVAKITMHDPGGALLLEREVMTAATECDRLNESAAIVVALMVDGVPEPAPEPAPAKPVPTPLHIAQTLVKPRSTVVFEGGLGPTFVIGLLPRVTGGLYGRVGVGLNNLWSIGLSLNGWLPTRTIDHDVGARMGAVGGEVDGCGAPMARRDVRLGVCLVAGGGVLIASPTGLVQSLDTHLPYAFIGPALGLDVHASGALWVHVRASVWGTIIAPQFFFHTREGTSQSLFSASSVLPGLSFGLMWHQPS
jgi:hypothetical protein